MAKVNEAELMSQARADGKAKGQEFLANLTASTRHVYEVLERLYEVTEDDVDQHRYITQRLAVQVLYSAGCVESPSDVDELLGGVPKGDETGVNTWDSYVEGFVHGLLGVEDD